MPVDSEAACGFVFPHYPALLGNRVAGRLTLCRAFEVAEVTGVARMQVDDRVRLGGSRIASWQVAQGGISSRHVDKFERHRLYRVSRGLDVIATAADNLECGGNE